MEKQTIANLAKQLLQEGKSTKEVIIGVQQAFPGSRIGPSAVSQYRKAAGLGRARAGRPAKAKAEATAECTSDTAGF